jgi:hypothetical protein
VHHLLLKIDTIRQSPKGHELAEEYTYINRPFDPTDGKSYYVVENQFLTHSIERISKLANLSCSALCCVL